MLSSKQMQDDNPAIVCKLSVKPCLHRNRMVAAPFRVRFIERRLKPAATRINRSGDTMDTVMQSATALLKAYYCVIINFLIMDALNTIPSPLLGERVTCPERSRRIVYKRCSSVHLQLNWRRSKKFVLTEVRTSRG